MQVIFVVRHRDSEHRDSEHKVENSMAGENAHSKNQAKNIDFIKHSGKGIASSVISIVFFVAFMLVLAFFFSLRQEVSIEELRYLIMFFSYLTIIVSMIGVGLGLAGWRSKKTKNMFSIFGFFLSLLLLFVSTFVFANTITIKFRIMVEVVLPLLVAGTIIGLSTSNYLAKERPLAPPGLIVATLLWIGIAGNYYLGIFPDISIPYRSLEDTFGLYYVLILKIIIFLFSIVGVFLSLKFRPIWAAWVFCFFVLIFNPWWQHQSFDGEWLIWQIIKNGTTLWLCIAGFIVYPQKIKRESVWNKYPLVIPTALSITLILWRTLMRTVFTEQLWYSVTSMPGYFLFLKVVAFSASIYATILSFILGPRWIAVVFFIIGILGGFFFDDNYSLSLSLVLWLCFSTFFIKAKNETR